MCIIPNGISFHDCATFTLLRSQLPWLLAWWPIRWWGYFIVQFKLWDKILKMHACPCSIPQIHQHGAQSHAGYMYIMWLRTALAGPIIEEYRPYHSILYTSKCSCTACTAFHDQRINVPASIYYTNVGQNYTSHFCTYIQGCRATLESRVALFGSVAGGIGFVFGILEVSILIIPIN